MITINENEDYQRLFFITNCLYACSSVRDLGRRLTLLVFVLLVRQRRPAQVNVG